MQFPSLDAPRTGILVAISSLRSQQSRGIGEFYDLKKLADWCRTRRISLIQILPVNDTGVQTSPYSALSAFALHPVYLSIEALPEYPDGGIAELEDIPTTADLEEPVAFVEVVKAKEAVLADIYARRKAAIERNAEFLRWIESNAWVKTYSVFRALRVEHHGAAWSSWPDDLRHGSSDLIDRYWTEGEEPARDPRFYAWLQFRLEQQLVEVGRYLEAEGVYLKGDLPILMNEDSADVWANPRIFRTSLRAGAPPDMFSELGQNWDFPIYDWDHLEETGFAWWKARLLQADKYYHAYRIDHVLGFFRIWAIPSASFSGTLGYFVPYPYFGVDLLHDNGFDEGRILWLAEPHIDGGELRKILADTEGEQSVDQTIDTAFRCIGDEDLYRFSDEIRGERDILDLEIPDSQRRILLELYRDRALIRVDADTYFQAWTFRECTRYDALAEDEKSVFERMSHESAEAAEEMWEEQGRRLLSFMSKTGDMLTCAEDLGVVPRSVPQVLESLNILGLRIPRWTRHYNKADEPYFTPDEYPRLTICATSVHDTSTVRGWWTDEADRAAYWKSLGLKGEPPATFSAEVAERMYRALAGVSSIILLFQIQDLFDLDDSIRRPNAEQDRVNVPGTVSGENWAYRWPVSLEDLGSCAELNRRIDAVQRERFADA